MKNTHKFRRKKGEVSAAMTLAVATFVIILLLLVFILFASFMMSGIFKKSQQESMKMSEKQKGLVSLMAYLQTPVNAEINGKAQNIEIRDLIKLALSNISYQSVLKEKTKEIFEPVYGKNYFIHADSMDIVSTTTGTSGISFSEILIPTMSEKPIKITFGVKNA